jgi:hypothetical protein
MCPQGFESRTDLRVHLMCEHRKSALADELLVAVEADRDRGEAPPVSVLDH